MNPIARPYEPRDRDGFNHVRSVVYRGGEAVRPDENLFPEGSEGTVVEVNGRIVGAATSLRIPMFVRGNQTLAGGVAAVAVVPEQRRGGVGSALMRGVGTQLYDQGCTLAALYGFREVYYRKLGYEVCGGRNLITCPSSRIPQFGDAPSVHQLPCNDPAPLLDAYYRFAHRYSGMGNRTDDLWDRVIGNDGSYAIYAVGDPIQAYAVVRLESGFWVKQAIREAVWTTYAGYKGLMNLFAALGMNKSTIEWYEPTDSTFLAAHMDQGVEVRQERQTMYRVLNVSSALQLLPAEIDADIRLNIVDHDIPANHATWHIRSRAGQIEATPGRDTAEVDVTIQQFTQMLLGEPSAQSLIELGLVQPRTASAESALVSLFPNQRTYCLDFY